MTMPGGLPAPRPDQGFAPTGAPMAPGSQTGVIRAREVIVSGPNGAVVGVFVYAAGATPGAGTGPIASLTNQADDPFGNATEPGVAAYINVGGTEFAVQLGAGNFAGSTVPGLFIHNMANPPSADPSFGGSASPAGSTATLFSGQSGAGSTGAGIQATDSTGSGVAGGEVDIVAGLANVQQNLQVGGNITATTATMDIHNGNIFLNMAIPTNFPTAGKTLAQTQACLDALITSMQNRQLIA